jgi:hypothetical protein
VTSDPAVAPHLRDPARLRRDRGDAAVRGEAGDETDQASRSAVTEPELA